jgi:hypothetical protein
MNGIYDTISAALLWLLLLPGVLPGLAVAVLVFGFRHARNVSSPGFYSLGVIAVAAALIGFSLVPTFARYIHARGSDVEWMWLLATVVVPFVVFCTGLQVMHWAQNR